LARQHRLANASAASRVTLCRDTIRANTCKAWCAKTRRRPAQPHEDGPCYRQRGPRSAQRTTMEVTEELMRQQTRDTFVTPPRREAPRTFDNTLRPEGCETRIGPRHGWRKLTATADGRAQHPRGAGPSIIQMILLGPRHGSRQSTAPADGRAQHPRGAGPSIIHMIMLLADVADACGHSGASSLPTMSCIT